jgi:hypothetical protein
MICKGGEVYAPLHKLAVSGAHAPVWLIYLCVCGEDVFKMLLGRWRLRSGRWLHNVTE